MSEPESDDEGSEQSAEPDGNDASPRLPREVILGPRTDGTALSSADPLRSAPDQAGSDLAKTTTASTSRPAPPQATSTRARTNKRSGIASAPTTANGTVDDRVSGRTTRSTRTPLLGLLGILALAAAGVFAYRMIGETEPDRTAEQAVADFLEALNRQDTIGAAETLIPHERDVLLTHSEDVLGQFQRLQVFGDVNLSRVGGTEVSVDNRQLNYETEELSDRVHRVVLTGSGLSFTGRGDQVAIGRLLTGSFGSTTNTVLADEVFTGGIEIMTERHEDRFHVSLLRTFAEVLRNYNGWPEPTYDSVIEPIGGSDPEDVVRQALRALEAGDLEKLVAMADPESGAVFYDLVPTWWTHSPQVKDFHGAADIEINAMSFTTTGNGDKREVRLTDFDYTHTPLGGDLFLREPTRIRTIFDGDCYRFEGDPGFPNARSGPIEERREGWLTGGICRTDLTNARREASLFAPFGGRGASAEAVTVVERNGRWFIHPTESVVAHWLDYVSGLRPMETDIRFDDGEGHWTVITGLGFRAFVIPLPGTEARGFADDSFLLEQLGVRN